MTHVTQTCDHCGEHTIDRDLIPVDTGGEICEVCRDTYVATADALTAHAIADLLAELDEPAGIAARLADVGLWPNGRRQPAPVREVRMVPVPTIPDSARWTAADRAQAARILSYQLAEMLSTYGSATTLQALALAYRADLQPAADAVHAPRLSASYQAAAAMLQGMAEQLDQDETEAQ